MHDLNETVWCGVALGGASNDPDGQRIGTRRVACNKNEINTPDVRARLVAQEVGTHADTHPPHAATPPLEAKRRLFSEWATGRARNGKDPKLRAIDVHNA